MTIMSGLKYEWNKDFDSVLAYFEELTWSKPPYVKSVVRPLRRILTALHSKL